jgi:OPA family glycerol-3-phosphate transporter-like MFS transporter
MTFFGLAVVLSILLACFYQTSAILCLLLAAIITGSMHGINLMFISFLPRRFAATGKVATVSGICNSCSYVGSCISSYGIALVAEKMGWQTTLFTWAGIALLGIVLCLVAYRKWSNFIR